MSNISSFVSILMGGLQEIEEISHIDEELDLLAPPEVKAIAPEIDTGDSMDPLMAFRAIVISYIQKELDGGVYCTVKNIVEEAIGEATKLLTRFEEIPKDDVVHAIIYAPGALYVDEIRGKLSRDQLTEISESVYGEYKGTLKDLIAKR